METIKKLFVEYFLEVKKENKHTRYVCTYTSMQYLVSLELIRYT